MDSPWQDVVNQEHVLNQEPNSDAAKLSKECEEAFGLYYSLDESELKKSPNGGAKLPPDDSSLANSLIEQFNVESLLDIPVSDCTEPLKSHSMEFSIDQSTSFGDRVPSMLQYTGFGTQSSNITSIPCITGASTCQYDTGFSSLPGTSSEHAATSLLVAFKLTESPRSEMPDVAISLEKKMPDVVISPGNNKEQQFSSNTSKYNEDKQSKPPNDYTFDNPGLCFDEEDSASDIFSSTDQQINSLPAPLLPTVSPTPGGSKITMGMDVPKDDIAPNNIDQLL